MAFEPLSDKLVIEGGRTIIFDDRDCVSSTNDLAKEAAECGAPEGYTVTAHQQTAGKGRLGRRFESPKDAGLYFTLILRPTEDLSNLWLVTVIAVTAMCETIRNDFGIDAQIKWVNDLYLDGLKISGTLTESVVDADGRARYVVVGTGVNLCEPEDGVPPTVQGIAGYLFDRQSVDPSVRRRILEGFMQRFFRMYDMLPETTCIDLYREYCFLPGTDVYVPKASGPVSARVLGISDDFGLIVRYENGTEEELSTGEVSVRGFRQQPRLI